MFPSRWRKRCTLMEPSTKKEHGDSCCERKEIVAAFVLSAVLLHDSCNPLSITVRQYVFGSPWTWFTCEAQRHLVDQYFMCPRPFRMSAEGGTNNATARA